MAVDNLKLLAGSLLDDVSLAVTSEHNDYPIENLQNNQPSQKWRSSSAAVQTIIALLTEDTPISAFALWAHNLTEDSSLRLELSQESDFSTLEYDATFDGLDPYYGLGEGPLGLHGLGGYSDAATIYPYTVHWFEVVIARYVRITLTDTANANGYLQAGRLMLGQEWSPTVNHDWGAAIKTQDDSALIRTRGGGLRATPHVPYRVIDVGFSWLDENDLAELERIRHLTGKRGGALISVYPNEGGTRERLYTVFGRLTSWSENSRQPTHLYYSGLHIEEAI